MTDDDELDGWAQALVPVLNEYAMLGTAAKPKPEPVVNRDLLAEMEAVYQRRSDLLR